MLSSDDEGTVDNNEVKLVFLGNSTVGKSSMMEMLLEGKFEEGSDTTHGIKSAIWPLEGRSFQVIMWDFGGQEYYHATHRFFLSRNAVSIVLFDAKHNRHDWVKTTFHENGQKVTRYLNHFPFEHWLAGIQHFSGEEALSASFWCKAKLTAIPIWCPS